MIWHFFEVMALSFFLDPEEEEEHNWLKPLVVTILKLFNMNILHLLRLISNRLAV